MCQQFRALAHQVHATTHEVAGAAHFTRIDVGLRKHAAAHVECMPQDECDAPFPAQVSDPVPGKHALDANDQIILVGRD